MDFKNLLRRISLFLISKKKWTLPKHVDILIYDVAGSELLINYFSNISYSILYTRGEEINISILIKKLFKKKHYINCYVDHVAPKVLITYIDNNPFFYLIKSNNPEITTIFIQNGIRSIVGDVFEYLINTKENNFFVDYMLCFNDNIAKKYCEYVNGDALVTGSFKNNLIPIKINKNNNNVLFISQFRNPKSDSGIMFYNSGKPVYWDDFYSAEKIILPVLHNFCKKQNLNLLICGCSTDNDFNEINFYKQILSSEDWNYIPRTSNFSAYEVVDDEAYVVTIDSTLGYEAIARNKRVAFFTIRGELCEIDGVDFGWPNHISKKGPYWTNGYNLDEVERVLNYIIQSSDEIWNDEINISINNILYYDNDNSKFKKLINTIIEK